MVMYQSVEVTRKRGTSGGPVTSTCASSAYLEVTSVTRPQPARLKPMRRAITSGRILLRRLRFGVEFMGLSFGRSTSYRILIAYSSASREESRECRSVDPLVSDLLMRSMVGRRHSL